MTDTAEIHKLLAMLSNDRPALARALGDEIERLREENALLTKGWQPATPTALRAEIERLKTADMLMVAQFESQEREITRMVKLLRQWRQAAEIAKDLTFAPVAKATDEVLGE